MAYYSLEAMIYEHNGNPSGYFMLELYTNTPFVLVVQGLCFVSSLFLVYNVITRIVKVIVFVIDRYLVYLMLRHS